MRPVEGTARPISLSLTQLRQNHVIHATKRPHSPRRSRDALRDEIWLASNMLGRV
jgi:hypothetical protein